MSSAPRDPDVLPHPVTHDIDVVKKWWRLYLTPGCAGDAYELFHESLSLPQWGMLLQMQDNPQEVANYMQWLNAERRNVLHGRWVNWLHRPALEAAVPSNRPRNGVQQPQQSQQQPLSQTSRRPHPTTSTVPPTLQPRVPQAGQGSSPYHSAPLPPDPYSYSQPPPSNTQWSHVQHPQPHLSQLPPPPGHQQPYIQSSQSIAPPGNTQSGYGYGHQSSGERPSQTPHTTPRAGTHPSMGVAGVGQEIRSGQGQRSRVPGSAAAAGGPAPAPEPSQTTGPRRPNFRLPDALHQERLKVAARVGNAQRQVILNWEEELAKVEAQMAAKQEQLASLGEVLDDAERSLDRAKNDARIAPQAQELRLQAGHHRGEAEISQETFDARKKQGNHTFPDYKHVSQSAKHMSTANAKDKQAAQVPTPNINADPRVIAARLKRDKAKAEYNAQKQLVDGDGSSVQAISNKLGREKGVYEQAKDCYGYESQTRFMQRESDNAWAGPVQQELDRWYSTNWNRLISST